MTINSNMKLFKQDISYLKLWYYIHIYHRYPVSEASKKKFSMNLIVIRIQKIKILPS